MLSKAPTPIDSELGADMDAVLLKAIHVDPEQRYASALEFRRDLLRARAGEPVDARSPDLVTDVRSVAARHPVATATTVVVAIVVLII